MVYMMAVYLVLLVSATSKYPWNLDTSVGSSTLPWMPVEHSWYAPEYQTPAGGATMKMEESDNRIGFEVMCLGRRSNVSIEKPGNFDVPSPLRTYGSTSSFLDFGNFDVPSPLLTYGSTSSFEHRDLFVEFFVESCALCAVDESLEMFTSQKMGEVEGAALCCTSSGLTVGAISLIFPGFNELRG